MENLDQQELDHLVMELIDGFGSLYEEVQLLSYKNRMLEDKLSVTKRMVSKASSHFSNLVPPSSFHT